MTLSCHDLITGKWLSENSNPNYIENMFKFYREKIYTARASMPNISNEVSQQMNWNEQINALFELERQSINKKSYFSSFKSYSSINKNLRHLKYVLI